MEPFPLYFIFDEIETKFPESERGFTDADLDQGLRAFGSSCQTVKNLHQNVFLIGVWLSQNKDRDSIWPHAVLEQPFHLFPRNNQQYNNTVLGIVIY